MKKSTALAIAGKPESPAHIATDADHSQAAAAYISNLSPGSRPTMTQSLAAITDTLLGREPARSAEENRRRVLDFRWGDLRAAHVAAIRARMIEQTAARAKDPAAGLSVATANKGLKALRKVLFEAWKLGQIEKDDYDRAVAFESIKGEAAKKGRALSAKEALKLVMSCDDDLTPLGARDGAMLALCLFAGLRRFEVAGLTVSSWDAEKAEIIVQGKGNKVRKVPVPDGVRVALGRWLAVRSSLLPADQVATRLFFGLTKGHRMRQPSLTTDGIFKALHQRALRAGVKSFSPHDLRRTYIGDLLDAGADLATAQKLAGHADPKITSGYDRRPEEVRRAAVQKLHAPFTRTT